MNRGGRPRYQENPRSGTHPLFTHIDTQVAMVVREDTTKRGVEDTGKEEEEFKTKWEGKEKIFNQDHIKDQEVVVKWDKTEIKILVEEDKTVSNEEATESVPILIAQGLQAREEHKAPE